jgi:hypothetical protein
MPVKQGKNRDKKNHTSWKPGQSGNPNGRPKKENSIAHILDEKLAEISDWDEFGKRTALEMIVDKAIAQAIGGDKDARNWVSDRKEGKALERVAQFKTKGKIEIKGSNGK